MTDRHDNDDLLVGSRRSRNLLRPPWRTGVAAAALLLAATGCSGVRGELVESGAEDDESSAELTFSDGSDRQATLFDFTAPDLYTGAPVDGNDMRDNAPLIMTFVVPSCPICVTEAPKLANAAEANPGVNFVVVHSFGEVDDFFEYTNAADLTHENTIHVVDVDGTLWERFGIEAQPSSILVDDAGRVSSTRGALGDDGLLRALGTVSDEPPSSGTVNHSAGDEEPPAGDEEPTADSGADAGTSDADTSDPGTDTANPDGESADG